MSTTTVTRDYLETIYNLIVEGEPVVGARLAEKSGSLETLAAARQHFRTMLDLNSDLEESKYARANLKSIDIPNGTGLRHTINLASENPYALETPTDFATRYSRLVDETTALFGANHYRHYDWLFTLSGQVEHFGLEHHESSDDRTGEDSITDEEARKWVSTLPPSSCTPCEPKSKSAAITPSRFDCGVMRSAIQLKSGAE